MEEKEIIGMISLVIAIISYIPYIRDILKGITHPHIFSWLIWGLLTGIAFVAQVSDGGGPGTWAAGISTIFSFFVVIIAFRIGEKDITKTDWISLIFGLAAIPIWVITDSPFWSIIIISIVDLIGFYPTFRKSYSRPHSENVSLYSLAALKYILAAFALTNFTFITAFYLFVMIISNAIFIIMVAWRRQSLKPSS